MRFLFFAGLECFFLFVNAQTNCKALRSGTYKTISDNTGTTQITRQNNLQVEINKEHGFKAEFKIEWLNECTYTLQPTRIWVNDNSIDADYTEILTVQILRVEKDYYAQRTTSNKRDMVVEGKVFIVGKK